MGRQKDTFKLATYGDDSLFWFLTHDEAARLARYDGYGDEFYILKFGCVRDRDTIDTLWCKHEQSLSEPGEAFEQRAQDPEKAV